MYAITDSLNSAVLCLKVSGGAPPPPPRTGIIKN
jgi:hypothetical protein